MDYQKAYEILHPDTTVQKLAEIEYYGGFEGKIKAAIALYEASVLACEAILELQQYKQFGTISEVKSAVDRNTAKEPVFHDNCGNKCVTKRCPTCFEVTYVEANYCMYCGQKLR